jgi:cell division protein FtsQ
MKTEMKTDTRPRMDPRIRERRVAVKRDEGRRRLRLFVAALTVVALLSLGWMLLHSPAFDVDHVRVTGNVHVHATDVVAASRLRRGEPMIDVREGIVARRVGRLPWVATARVTRRWPATVVIDVRERRPAAAARARAGGWMLVDAGGRLLAATPLPPPELEALEGTPPAGAPGEQLAPAALAALRVASLLPPARVSVVRVVALLPDGTLELRLSAGGVVRFGPPDHAQDKLTAALTVIDHVGAGAVGVLDVRVPESPVLTRR